VGEVVESVRSALAAAGAMVKCAEAVEGTRGWTVTAYVQPDALKLCRQQLFAHAKQSLLQAAERSEKVLVLGYASNAFSPMPLGFGAALAEMQDPATACWGSFAHGFCDRPSTCCKAHPRNRTGIHVMLKPARNRR
jgi:hypothetical protein